MDPNQTQDTYEVEAATRLSRFGATLIDLVLQLAPLAPIFLLLPGAMLTGRMGMLLVGLLAAAVVWVALLITQIVLLVKNGQTIGKKVMGIRMITSEGEIPSLWRVFLLRWLPFVVTAATIELIFKVRGLGNLIHLVDVLLIFQPTRRCLHDLFADTHLIKA